MAHPHSLVRVSTTPRHTVICTSNDVDTAIFNLVETRVHGSSSVAVAHLTIGIRSTSSVYHFLPAVRTIKFEPSQEHVPAVLGIQLHSVRCPLFRPRVPLSKSKLTTKPSQSPQQTDVAVTATDTSSSNYFPRPASPAAIISLHACMLDPLPSAPPTYRHHAPSAITGFCSFVRPFVHLLGPFSLLANGVRHHNDSPDITNAATAACRISSCLCAVSVAALRAGRDITSLLIDNCSKAKSDTLL